MSAAKNATCGGLPAHTALPFRRTIVMVETLVGLGGLAGSIQLLAGAATPPVSVLNPLGLSSWTLPAGWLFLAVAVPSGLAAWLAWQRSVWAAPAVLLASALLAIELLVQIPFLGFSICKRSLALWPSVWRRWDCWPEERAGGRAGVGQQQ